MDFLPSKSAIKHSRFFFSFFLLPVYVFALSQAKEVHLVNAALVFLIWHVLVYPASNGYNSYFDKDEGSIALVENPPPVDKSLYVFSLGLDLAALLLASIVGLQFVFAVVVYGVISKMYSHPKIRLKKYPLISFLVVFFFQGAFVYWSSYTAISNGNVVEYLNGDFILAGFICSCLIGASYPLTQVYQHDEDARRGDKTLSRLLGLNGTFLFSALLFFVATALMFVYWNNLNQLLNFYLFIIFIVPVLLVFVKWVYKLKADKSAANFRNMGQMMTVSGTAMLAYFLLLLFVEYHK